MLEYQLRPVLYDNVGYIRPGIHDRVPQSRPFVTLDVVEVQDRLLEVEENEASVLV